MEQPCASSSNQSDIAAASRGLDHLNLFVANIQTGFGPFIAIYLASQGWSQTAIGIALTIGTVSSMASQIPAGALVDAMRNKVNAARAGILSFTVSALMFAIYPVQLFVYIAEILHSFASCMLAPAVAAISRAVTGEHALGRRFGRNARYASIGNAIGAALMGASGYYFSERSIFFLTALLTLPAFYLMAPLSRLKAPRIAAAVRADETSRAKSIRQLLKDRRLFVFACCVALFTFGNAETLPLVGSALNKSVGNLASLMIAASIVLPQVIVALISPGIGRLAEMRGRRFVLMIGLAALPLRCVIFALLLGHPGFIITAQALDGIAAASLGVLVPLITSDIAGRSGHFNLSLGFIGFFMGIGSALSTALGGWMADRLGDPLALLGLGTIGLLAVLLAFAAMPETRREDESA